MESADQRLECGLKVDLFVCSRSDGGDGDVAPPHHLRWLSRDRGATMPATADDPARAVQAFAGETVRRRREPASSFKPAVGGVWSALASDEGECVAGGQTAAKRLAVLRGAGRPRQDLCQAQRAKF